MFSKRALVRINRARIEVGIRGNGQAMTRYCED